MRIRGAYSLVELLFTLALVGILLGLAGPPMRRALAYARVRAARDAVVAQAGRARAFAVARGGADLVLDLPHRRAWLEAADTATQPLSLAGDAGVRLVSDGVGSDTVRIGFDALGLGRMANRTLRFQAAGVEARLTISAYGRVRTW